MKPILLFDVMETLVTEPFFTALPEFFGMSVDELRREIHPTAWIEFEEGRITESEYYARFFSDGRHVDADQLRRCVRDAFHWLEGMQELLADLQQAGYQMHALSNYSTWYEIIEDKLQLSRYLAWTFVSCKTGLRKPDPKSYLGAARTLQVPPQDCLFIDDRPVNIDGARNIGMDAILQTGARHLRPLLAQRGLPT